MESLIRIAVFILIFVVTIDPSVGQNSESTSDEFPALGLVKKWADGLSVSLTSTLDEVTGIRELKQRYERKNLSLEFINGTELIEDVAQKWQAILQKKMTAVRKIVDKLEQDFANYTANHDIQIGDVEYKNSKNLTNLTLTYDERFKSDVNLNCSSVQIPTDIYEGDKVILNGIQATEGVDSVFLSNFEEDPQLLWQYFGSADGFYRSYPAKEWVSAGEPDKDQYDVRRRGWYIQATSSPKDVMILIDSSGSTYGMTLKIIKVSVSKALDTLGNDDFVNVASFSEDVHNVSCFDTFVQANLRNKKELNDAVQNGVTAGGIADFSKALNYAFDEFDKFNETERKAGDERNQGADCIRVIMIFTDGGTSAEEAIFRERNRNPFKARVFVYKVGADSMVSSDGIKHMACTNKGYFSTIQSFGAVRLTTLDYVPVVSRPMVLSGQKNFQWSDIYLDALGLGMMTTLTLPVYNTTSFIVPGSDNITAKSQQLLGVVGTDITTKNMADTVPMNKPEYNSSFSQSIGPQAYVFGINSNGYILLHPRLKAELNYLSDPPNVDFLEVEYETPEKEALRKDMIDRKSGTVKLDTPIMSRDERYLEFVNMTYSFTFIDNTTFSVAIAQPSFDLFQFKAPTSMNLKLALNYIMHREDILIAPWEFCEQFVGMDPEDITTAEIKEAIQSTIKNASDLSSDGTITLQTCNDEMVRKLFVDAEITSNLSAYWETKIDIINDNGFIFVLAATQGGLTTIFIPGSNIDSAWSQDEKRSMQDPWEQSYYQRSLYTDRYVFSVPYNSGEGPMGSLTEFRSNITISKSVALDNEAVPAVVMAMLDPAYFNDSWSLTSEGFNNRTLDNSCANMELKCYLLDDGGFIIATNQNYEQDEVGRFFGEIDGDIMTEMIDNGIYEYKWMYDYQAACEKMPPSDSAGIKSWFVPTLRDVFNFNVWATSAIWSFIHHTFMDFLLFGWSDYSIIDAAETAESLGNVSCIKLINNYYFGQNLSTEGVKECVNCSRKWAASRVGGTNLVMIITEMECVTCPMTVVKQAPEEPDVAPNPCLETPRYRRRPSENCYAFSEFENTTICKGVISLASPWLLLILHIFYLGVVWLVSA